LSLGCGHFAPYQTTVGFVGNGGRAIVAPALKQLAEAPPRHRKLLAKRFQKVILFRKIGSQKYNNIEDQNAERI
jgi:hypothetical protein